MESVFLLFPLVILLIPYPYSMYFTPVILWFEKKIYRYQKKKKKNLLLVSQLVKEKKNCKVPFSCSSYLVRDEESAKVAMRLSTNKLGVELT